MSRRWPSGQRNSMLRRWRGGKVVMPPGGRLRQPLYRSRADIGLYGG
jgi:hypothetical protein